MRYTKADLIAVLEYYADPKTWVHEGLHVIKDDLDKRFGVVRNPFSLVDCGHVARAVLGKKER